MGKPYFNMSTENLSINYNDLVTKEFANNLIKLLINYYNELIPSLMNSIISPIFETKINDFFQVEINKYNNTKCIESIKMNDHSIITQYSFGSIAVITIIIVIILLFIPKSKNIKNHESTISLINELPVTDSKPTSLLLNTKIHMIIRFSVTILLLINIGVYVFSNVSIGGSLFIVINIANRYYQSSPLYIYSLFSNVTNMWKSNQIIVTLLIAISCGVLPYITLVTLLCCWVLPTSLLNTKYRFRFLLLVNYFSKWCLVSSFVLIILIFVFQFEFSTTMTNMIPPQKASFDLFLEPFWECYKYVEFSLNFL